MLLPRGTVLGQALAAARRGVLQVAQTSCQIVIMQRKRVLTAVRRGVPQIVQASCRFVRLQELTLPQDGKENVERCAPCVRSRHPRICIQGHTLASSHSGGQRRVSLPSTGGRVSVRIILELGGGREGWKGGSPYPSVFRVHAVCAILIGPF